MLPFQHETYDLLFRWIFQFSPSRQDFVEQKLRFEAAGFGGEDGGERGRRIISKLTQRLAVLCPLVGSNSSQVFFFSKHFLIFSFAKDDFLDLLGWVKTTNKHGKAAKNDLKNLG